MQLLNLNEGVDWLRLHGSDRFTDTANSDAVIRFEYAIPPDSGAKTALARFLVSDVLAGSAVGLLIDEHGIWPSSENPLLFAKYREAVAGVGSLEQFPFQAATAEELPYMEGLFALSLYFVWGVQMMDAHGDVYIRTSHDEWITIAFQDSVRAQAFHTMVAGYALSDHTGKP